MAPLFTEPTERYVGFLAGTLIVFAQVVLLRDVYRRKMHPSLLSWLGWALLMGTSLVAQIWGSGWQWSLVGLFLSTLGCLAIFTLAAYMNHFMVRKSDWIFLSLGLICLVIYLLSKDPWLTTGFAILADFTAGFPTIQQGYARPHTQKSLAWLLALISWSFALLICIGHEWLYALFPIYLFLYNGTMLYLTRIRQVANDAVS